MNKKLPFILAICIIIHHYYKHRNDNKRLIEKIIQYNDIDNHETWALFFVGIGIGLYLN